MAVLHSIICYSRGPWVKCQLRHIVRLRVKKTNKQKTGRKSNNNQNWIGKRERAQKWASERTQNYFPKHMTLETHTDTDGCRKDCVHTPILPLYFPEPSILFTRKSMVLFYLTWLSSLKIPWDRVVMGHILCLLLLRLSRCPLKRYFGSGSPIMAAWAHGDPWKVVMRAPLTTFIIQKA